MATAAATNMYLKVEAQKLFIACTWTIALITERLAELLAKITCSFSDGWTSKCITVTYCEINRTRNESESELKAKKFHRIPSTTKTLQKMFTPLMQLKSIVLSLIGKRCCKEKDTNLKQQHQGNVIHERKNCFRKLKKLYKLKKCTNHQLVGAVVAQNRRSH